MVDVFAMSALRSFTALVAFELEDAIPRQYTTYLVHIDSVFFVVN